MNIEKECVTSKYMKKLTEDFYGNNRTMTVNNQFSSVKLFDDML